MWLHTIVLTLFFFLICLGFGFLILTMASVALIEESRLTRLQLIALGFAIGGPGTGIFLQLLSVVSHDLGANLGMLLCVSLIGFLATQNVWRPRRRDLNEIALWAALSLPLAMITWWWSFGAFSQFPFGDLGTDVHWMKAAREYADTGIINPYTSQSYVDLRPALAGALSGTLGLDLLQFDWVYRYFSILVLLVGFYAVASSVFLDPHRKWFAFFFASAGNTLGILTNGSLAVAASFVFLSVLLKIDAKTEPQRNLCISTLLAVAGALFSVLAAFFLNNNALMLALLAALSLVFNVLNRTGGVAKNVATTTFASVVWSATLIFVHRGSYLFVPIVLSAWLFYIIVSRIISKAASPYIKALWALALALPLVCICIVTWVVAVRLGYLPPMSANKLFSHITFLVLGRAINDGDEISLGLGPEVATIEIARAMGPLFAVGAGLMVAWWCETFRPARLKQLSSPLQSGNAARLLWSWIMGCGLCVIVLTGFPFLYRLTFIILGFFTIATTELFFQSFVDPLHDSDRRRRLSAVIAATVVAVLVAGFYSFSWVPDRPYSGYQAMIRPLEIAGVGLVLLFAALTFVRSRQIQICALATVFGLSVAIDRSGISTLFRVYSYGRLPDHAVAVSHYSPSDLKMAHWLHNNMRNAVVVSDPYTLGMARAIAGSPGIYLFSNLDTVNEQTANQIKSIISGIVEPAPSSREKALKACASLSPLLGNLNAEALAQLGRSNLIGGILKAVRPEEDKRETEVTTEPQVLDDAARQTEVFANGPQGKWNVVAIINLRTIQWSHLGKGQRLSYFPVDEPLNREILEALRNGPFRILFSDGHSAIVRIACT